jgi:hypothetical protein
MFARNLARFVSLDIEPIEGAKKKKRAEDRFMLA